MPDPLTPEGLERFGEVAASHVGDDKVPGLVALVARRDQVHVEVHGSLTIGGPPVRRDSLFRIASTTKPITGAATMTLVDDGLLHLDDPIASWLPELASPQVLRRIDGPLDDTVAASRPITVRDLLTFTYGFGMILDMFAAPEPWPVVTAAADLGLQALGPPQPALQPDPDTWMAGLGSLPLMAQPGERWLYNGGALVLGVLLARVTGQPIADVFRARVFDPLGLSDTAFFAADPSRLPTAYVGTPDGLQVWDPPDGQWSRPPVFGDAAAGLVSTADDLLAFARIFLADGLLLSKESITAMTSDHLTAEQRTRDGRGFLAGDRSWAFCQSVVVDGPRAGAFGWDGGLGTSWLVDPARQLTVIVLTQRLFDSPQAPAVHTDLQDAAYTASASIR